METDSGEWMEFFKATGLPESAAAKYAVIFSKHRIQLNMLKDLSKEILYDMGIRTIGDVIAILRHAKEVDEETTKVKILGKDPRRKVPTEPVSNKRIPKAVSDSGLKRSLDDEDSFQKPKIRKILPPKNTTDLETREYMSSESTYVIKMPSILPPKAASSVFRRLGAQEEESIKQPIIQSNSSVFSRLGTSQPVRVVNPIKNTTSVLRGAEGASMHVFGTAPQRTIATVKPTNVLVRKSLAEAKATTATRQLGSQRVMTRLSAPPQRTASSLQSMNRTAVNIKNRLGNNSSTLNTNAAKKLVVTSQPKKKTLSLKKSIFDRLGPV